MRWTETARSLLVHEYPANVPTGTPFEEVCRQFSILGTHPRSVFLSARSKVPEIVAEIAGLRTAVAQVPPRWTARQAGLAAALGWVSILTRERAPSPVAWAFAVTHALGGRGLVDALVAAGTFAVEELENEKLDVTARPEGRRPEVLTVLLYGPRIQLAWSDASVYEAARKRVVELHRPGDAWLSCVVPAERSLVEADADHWLARTPDPRDDSPWESDGELLLSSLHDRDRWAAVAASMSKHGVLPLVDPSWAAWALHAFGDAAPALLAPYVRTLDVFELALTVENASAELAVAQLDNGSAAHRRLAAQYLADTGVAALAPVQASRARERLTEIVLGGLVTSPPTPFAARWKAQQARRLAKPTKAIARLPAWAAPHTLPSVRATSKKPLGNQHHAALVVAIASAAKSKPTSAEVTAIARAEADDTATLALELFERWWLCGAPDGQLGILRFLLRRRPVGAAEAIARVALAADSEASSTARELRDAIPMLAELPDGAAQLQTLAKRRDLGPDLRSKITAGLRATQDGADDALASLPAATRKKLLASLDRVVGRDYKNLARERMNCVDDDLTIAEAWIDKHVDDRIAGLLAGVKASDAVRTALHEQYRSLMLVRCELAGD